MKYLLSLMLVTAMTCQTIKTPRNFVRMYRGTEIGLRSANRGEHRV